MDRSSCRFKLPMKRCTLHLILRDVLVSGNAKRWAQLVCLPRHLYKSISGHSIPLDWKSDISPRWPGFNLGFFQDYASESSCGETQTKASHVACLIENVMLVMTVWRSSHIHRRRRVWSHCRTETLLMRRGHPSLFWISVSLSSKKGTWAV